MLVHSRIFLQAVDYELKLNRFYCISLGRNLFKEWTLIVRWGKKGSQGQRKIMTASSFEQALVEARKMVKKRLSAKSRIGINYSIMEAKNAFRGWVNIGKGT